MDKKEWQNILKHIGKSYRKKLDRRSETDSQKLEVLP